MFLFFCSDIQSHSFDENKQQKQQITEVEDEEKQLSCCAECSAKFETEARSLQNSNNSESTTSSSPLPAWLQQYKNEQKAMGENDQVFFHYMSLCTLLLKAIIAQIFKEKKKGPHEEK